jgi:hypothetical protein
MEEAPYVVFVLAFEGWLILVGTLLICDLHRVPLWPVLLQTKYKIPTMEESGEQCTVVFA